MKLGLCLAAAVMLSGCSAKYRPFSVGQMICAGYGDTEGDGQCGEDR